MADKGAHVVIAGRDADKLEQAAEDLRQQPEAAIDTAPLDLATLRYSGITRGATAPPAQLFQGTFLALPAPRG